MGSKYRWLAAVLWVAILTLPGISRGASTNVLSMADATVCSGWSDLNFGGYEDIAVGYSFRGEVFPLYKKAILMRSLLRFDLQSRLPGGVYASNITGARIRLSLREVNSSRIFDAPLSLWLVTNSWSEGEVTWNSRPHGEPVPVTHSWRTNVVPQQLEIILPAAVVRNWWSNPAANHGVELSCPWAETNNFFASFATREAGVSAPMLEISYTEPARYTIAGQVTSPNWPYGGLAGMTVTADSGETTITSPNGTFVLSRVPWGQHRITAQQVDYATEVGSPETWQEMLVTSNLDGIRFTNLSCKARPEVRVNIATNIVAPGETINVELTLENVGGEVESVAAQVELSLDPGLVAVGTVTTNTWPGTIAHYPPGTRYPTDYGVRAQTEQQAFGSNQSFSFSVPLTVLHTLSTGEITLKFRGVIEDRLVPADATGNYLDQAGWPVWASNITVVKPMQLLGQSISTTNVRDGQTITVGYQVYSRRKINCVLGCILQKPGAPGVIRDETREGEGTPEVLVTEGTNWYYRDFFLNLGPADTPGAYDVVWSVQENGAPALQHREQDGIRIEPPLPIRIPILMYHKVGPIAYSYYWITTDALREQLQALKAYGYTPVTLDEAMRARAGIGTMPAKPVVITFDDGNETLLTHVFPVLADPSIDFKATSFFLSGKAGQPATWDNDCCIVTRHLTWEEVETLHNSGRIDFQSHGVNHPYYPSLSLPEIYADMVESRQTLEARLQKPVRFLAYPYGGYGSYDQNIVQTARAAGYFAGVTAWGDMERDCTNKYILRRVAVNFNSSLDYSPDSPEFFFNFDDMFVVPEISVNEIRFLGEDNQAPIPGEQVWPGQTVKIQVIATNAGPPTETIAVIQFARDGDTNQIVYDSHFSDPSMDIRTNFVTGSQSFEWLWRIPTNTPPGWYQAHVKFYDKHHLLGLHDAGWHPAFDVQALLPDLRAEAVTLSRPLVASASADVGFRVANIGSADAGAFECKIVLSPTENLEVGLTVLGQIAIPGLPQGQSTSGLYSVSFPDSIRPNRPYYLGLVADDPGGMTNFGSVLEGNGQEVTNNVFWQSVMWEASPPAPIIDAANSTHATNQWSTNRQVNIRWTCITELFDIVGYSVGVDSVPDTDPPTTGTTTNQNWSSENVLDTATLYLHVRSQDAGGQWSATTHFGPIMIDSTPPPCPGLVKPVSDQNVSRTELLFDWSDVVDNLSSLSYDYRLSAEVENDGEVEMLEALSISNLVTSSYMLEGLQLRDGRYYWSTRACDAAGNKSEWTAWESFWRCSATGAVDLVVGYYEQEKFEHGWGWAAGLSMLLSYSGHDLKPWEIASEFHAGIGDAVSIPMLQQWLQTNYPAVTWIEESLEYAPVNRVIRRCASALSQGGPVLVAREHTPWLWPPAHGSDAIVLVGYEGLNGTDIVYFHDPGNGISNSNVICRTLTWTALAVLLSEKWSSLGPMRMLYASGGALKTNSPGLTLALMPGTGDRPAGLRWEHMRDGTNFSAWLEWDGKHRGGYYYTSAVPEEFPVDPTAETNEPALAVTVRDDLVVTPFVANSFSNALHMEFEGRIFSTNGTEAVHFRNTNRLVIPPYTAETRNDLAIIQRLSSVPLIEPGHEYTLELVVNGYASERGPLLASATNRFQFRVEPWPMGMIQIFINPELTNSNFAWRLDGSAWQTNGAALCCLSLGSHLLEFANIDGWTAPPREWLVISNTEPVIITIAYSEGGNSVQVTLEPSEALTAGARWRIDGGEWFESAVTVGGINPGEHLLEFKEASGWLAPSNTTVLVESNRVMELRQAYTKRGGSLRVSVSPDDAAVLGVYWQIDGTGAWHRTGDTIFGLSVGTHQINFSDLAGWIKPAAVDVTVKESEIADLGATYTQAVGSMTVIINPPEAIQSGAQWRLEGGQWRDSGFVETNITSSAYLLEFKTLTGWRRPSDQNITLIPAQAATVEVTYIEKIAPSIVSEPVSRAQLPGTSVAFDVVAAGTEPLFYQWQRDGTNISEHDNISGIGDSQLTVQEINFEDAGRYSVWVTNMYGAVTSEVALLIIPNRVVVWGNNTYGQTNVPSECSNAVAIAAGAMHAAALTDDGRPLIWGGSTNGSSLTSPEASNVVAVAAGRAQTLALLADGAVLAWGVDAYGEASVPANLANVVAVAGGDGFSVALNRDGTVTAWGRSDWGVTNVPASATNVVSVACGTAHIVALKNDNTVVCWGSNDAGQASPPQGLGPVVAVAAGDNHSVALRSDGSIVTWGNYGETPVAAELTNAVGVAAGEQYSVALKDDGRIVACGTGTNTVGTPPWWMENVINVSARGSNAAMALLGTGSPSLTVQPWNRSVRAGTTTTLYSMAVGADPLAFQWRKNGADLDDSERYKGTRSRNLIISGAQATDAGAFTLVVSNSLGALTSKVATLTVTEPGWQWARAVGSSNLVANNLSVDGTGNIFLAGTFQGTAVVGTNVLEASTGNQAFVAKYDYDGALLWVQQVSGSNNSVAVKGVSVETGHNVVAGQFTGMAEFGTNLVESMGLQDVFVVRYSTAGEVIWVQQTGTELDDTVGGFELDSDGNALLVINSGTTNVGENVCRMVKYDTNGLLVFSEPIALGSLTNLSLAVDGENNLYTLISFSGSILFGTNTLETSGVGTLLAKFDSAGAVIGVKSLGGDSGTTIGQELVLDNEGNIYVRGMVNGAAQLGTNHLMNGPFLIKLANSGDVLWAVVPGGQFEGEFNGILMHEDAIFVQGTFQGEIRLQEFTLFSQAPTVYLAKYDLNGTVLWVKQIGTLNKEGTNSSIAADFAGNVYFAGNFIDGVRLATNVVQNQRPDLLLAKLELAPLIVQQPVGHFARYASPAIFSIQASGTNIKYQWWKNFMPLSNSARISGVEAGRLEFASVQLEDAGDYRVVVSTASGSVTSHVARLEVAGFVQAQVDSAGEGETLIISPGRYYDNIVLQKDVILQGSGDHETIIIGHTSEPVFSITSNITVGLENLAVGQGVRGGIWNAGNLQLNLVTLSSNTASAQDTAAGINNSGRLTGHRVIISGNESANGSGGIWNSGTLVLSNSMVSGNTSSQGGGVHNRGEMVLQSCTISGNACKGAGGIANFGVLALTNCTVSGNSSQSGAGAVLNEGSATLSSCTVCSNTSQILAGGIISTNEGATALLRNTIVANNESPGLVSELSGLFVSGGNNLIFQVVEMQGETNSNIVGQDPRLGPLFTNGGHTLTHALLAGSPAIDRGSSSGSTTDQRGYPRPENWPLLMDSDDGADIGAFEASPGLLSPPISCNPLTNFTQSNLFFSVSATGTEPLYYQWRFNDIDMDNGEIVQGAQTPTLIISNAQLHHAGSYSLVISNDSGAITSQVYALTLPVPPPMFLGVRMSSNGFGFRFAGLTGENYIVEETSDFVTWTAVASLTNLDGQVHWTRPEPLAPVAQFYRARIALQDVVFTFNPGSLSSNAVARYYNDGYVLIDSLGNTNGQTYYWGYDATSQVDGGEIRLHAYGTKNGKAVWVITDTYSLNGMVVPEAPYRGLFNAPESGNQSAPPLTDIPVSRKITFQ